MQISLLVAVLFSPVVAVGITLWYQSRRERRQAQLGILMTLIANRQGPVNPETVQALNMIDLVFWRKKNIRALWREYFEMLSNQGLNNELGYGLRAKKNLELITAMAQTLGYGKSISHLDMDRVYRPIAEAEHLRWNQDFQAELLRVLKATARLQVEPVAVHPTEEAPRAPLPSTTR